MAICTPVCAPIGRMHTRMLQELRALCGAAREDRFGGGDVSGARVYGPVSLRTHVEVRLRFLAFVATCGARGLTVDMITIVWEELVDPCWSPALRAWALAWLSDAANSAGLLVAGTAELFFASKLAVVGGEGGAVDLVHFNCTRACVRDARAHPPCGLPFRFVRNPYAPP